MQSRALALQELSRLLWEARDQSSDQHAPATGGKELSDAIEQPAAATDDRATETQASKRQKLSPAPEAPPASAQPGQAAPSASAIEQDRVTSSEVPALEEAPMEDDAIRDTQPLLHDEQAARASDTGAGAAGPAREQTSTSSAGGDGAEQQADAEMHAADDSGLASTAPVQPQRAQGQTSAAQQDPAQPTAPPDNHPASHPHASTAMHQQAGQPEWLLPALPGTADGDSGPWWPDEGAVDQATVANDVDAAFVTCQCCQRRCHTSCLPSALQAQVGVHLSCFPRSIYA